MPMKPKTHKQRMNSRRQRDAEYEARRKADPALAESKRSRGSARYKRFRAWFRRQYPVCCDPFGHHGYTWQPMAQVHHIIPLRERPDLLCDQSNAASLCTYCHSRIEGMERAGKPTAHLFNREGRSNL